VGTRVWIILRGAREFCGILRGFDEYVNLFLEDVDEYTYSEEFFSVVELSRCTIAMNLQALR